MTSSGEIEAIVKRVVAGDTEAYREIVRGYQQRIWRIVAFAFHDLHLTEDLVQRVFVLAYFKLHTYESGRDFGRWLQALARNLARQELRARTRQNRHLSLYRERLLRHLSDQERAGRHEDHLRDLLEECRQKLSPAAHRAIDLRYMQARGFEEIAGILGRTVAATRQMLGRIRLVLRECIEERSAQS